MTADNQRANVRMAAKAIAPIAAAHQLVIGHGNGPQAGLLALQGAAYARVELYPLDVLGAQTEGMIGYMLEQELGNLLPFERPLATVQTMVEIGPQLFRTSKPQDLGSLKLTVQQFYRPSGDSTQQRGVLADITLPSITDHMDVAEGDLDYPVAFDKVQDAHARAQCRHENGAEPWACSDCDCTARLDQRLKATGTSFLTSLRRSTS